MAPRKVPIGKIVDNRYEITGLIGRGGFARVYKAKHIHIDREVALKVMSPKVGDIDQNFDKRFVREAKIAARIEHSNSVTIYDFGFDGPKRQPYIAMELLRGHDLRRELKKFGPLAPARALDLFAGCLDALAQGHKLGVVHKDLKPANLFLSAPMTPSETMKILDFGVARIGAAEANRVTDTGHILGTPQYLAPEYIKDQAVSPAVDVYQMALIFVEAVTGKIVVDGNPYDVIRKHCSGDFDLPDLFRTGPVGEVFKRALSLEPTERFPDAAAFRDALLTLKSELSDDKPLFELASSALDFRQANDTVVAETSFEGDDNETQVYKADSSPRTPSKPARLASPNTSKGHRDLFADGAQMVDFSSPSSKTSDNTGSSAPATAGVPDNDLNLAVILLFFVALGILIWVLTL